MMNTMIEDSNAKGKGTTAGRFRSQRENHRTSQGSEDGMNEA